MKSWISSIRPENFTEEVILEKKPVLLICLDGDESSARQLRVLQDVAQRYERELKVGLLAQDSLETFKRKLQISGTPTFLLMLEGKEIGRVLGIIGEELLTNLIDQHISTHYSENEEK
jgi:thioredoxin-like negative regulator of GroEL